MTDQDGGQSEYTYTRTQRRRILDAIQLPDEAIREAFMSRLTFFARAAINEYETEPRPPYQGEVRRELERLGSLISNLRPGTRDFLHTVLVEDCKIGLDNLVNAIETAVARTADELPSRGRPRNPAAKLFIERCFYLWLHHTGRVPPRSPSSRSPFYRFVNAALPVEVYDRSGHIRVGEGITSLLLPVLADTHRRFDSYVRMGWEHRP